MLLSRLPKFGSGTNSALNQDLNFQLDSWTREHKIAYFRAANKKLVEQKVDTVRGNSCPDFVGFFHPLCSHTLWLRTDRTKSQQFFGPVHGRIEQKIDKKSGPAPNSRTREYKIAHFRAAPNKKKQNIRGLKEADHLFTLGSVDAVMKTLTGENLTLDTTTLLLEKLAELLRSLDDRWVQSRSTPPLSKKVKYLVALLRTFQEDFKIAIGTAEVWRAFKASRTKPSEAQPPTPSEKAGQDTIGLKIYGYAKTGGIMLWLFFLSILVAKMWRTGTKPLPSMDLETHQGTNPTDWWSNEDSMDSDEPDDLDWTMMDEGVYKHRRNLLEAPLMGPTFGEGISMHASQQTWLSEFMIGLMIVDAFCIWLLVLYPPLGPYRKRIVGGGIIIYSIICILVNLLPWAKTMTTPTTSSLLVALNTKLPDYKQVESERRETYQLYREQNAGEMDPLYRRAIMGSKQSPRDIINHELHKHCTDFNLYCFVGYRRTVRTTYELGEPMQYELALGVAAESRKGIFTNVIPISKALSETERLEDIPTSNVDALVNELYCRNPVYQKTPNMFRPMIVMNFLRLIHLSVDGFQGTSGISRFFLKEATMIAFSATRDRGAPETDFTVVKFWGVMALMICTGLLFTFWDVWRFRRQLLASHVILLCLWGGSTFLCGSRRIFPTLVVGLTIPLLILCLFFCKDFILLRWGVGWIFTKSKNIPADCEDLLPRLSGVDRLLARSLGLPTNAMFLHYVECESVNKMFNTSNFIQASLNHTKRIRTRRLALPARTITRTRENFQPQIMKTWTDQRGLLSFQTNKPEDLVKVDQCVLGNRLGRAWGNARSIPIPADQFTSALTDLAGTTNNVSVVTPQFSMIFYQEVGTLSRRKVLFLCYLALRAQEGVYRRALAQHILKYHLLGIPEGSDVAQIITNFFNGTLGVPELESRIYKLVWNQLPFLRRAEMFRRRLVLGKPLFPIENLMEALPPPFPTTRSRLILLTKLGTTTRSGNGDRKYAQLFGV